MKDVLEIKRTLKDDINPDSNVIFNVPSPYSEGINYNPVTGEITLVKTGQYSVRWWVATETTLAGCMQFALKPSQGDIVESCSPTKKGQLAGFGVIDVQDSEIKMALVNNGRYPVVLSQTSPVTAALLVMRIPEDGVIPSFDVEEVITLGPGESAAAKVQEDADNPNNWLFSFGIPMGETGAPGITPHIDTDSGNWFIGDVDTNVRAQGAEGPKGDTGPLIYAQP